MTSNCPNFDIQILTGTVQECAAAAVCASEIWSSTWIVPKMGYTANWQSYRINNLTTEDEVLNHQIYDKLSGAVLRRSRRVPWVETRLIWRWLSFPGVPMPASLIFDNPFESQWYADDKRHKNEQQRRKRPSWVRGLNFWFQLFSPHSGF